MNLFVSLTVKYIMVILMPRNWPLPDISSSTWLQSDLHPLPRPRHSKKKHRSQKSLTDIIVGDDYEKSLNDIQRVFEEVKVLATSGVCGGLDGFSDEIEEIVTTNMENLEELRTLKKQYRGDDIAVSSSFFLPGRFYDLTLHFQVSQFLSVVRGRLYAPRCPSQVERPQFTNNGRFQLDLQSNH